MQIKLYCQITTKWLLLEKNIIDYYCHQNLRFSFAKVDFDLYLVLLVCIIIQMIIINKNNT